MRDRIIVIFVMLAVLAASSSPASAASGTWSSTATSPGSWATTTNWVSSIVPGATGTTGNTDTATFNSSSSATTVTPDSNRNLEFIIFDTSAVAYTISGNALLLTSGGTIQIAGTFSGSNTTETINAPLTLEGSYTFADNSTNTGVLLNFGGAIMSGLAGTQTLTISGGDNTTMGGAIGAGAGTIALAKSGAGTLTLSGNNSFTGGVTINAGTLLLNSVGALNSGTPNSVAFGAASTGILSLNGRSVTVGGLSTNVTAGSPLVQNASATPALLTINNASSNTYAGILQDGAGGGALTLIKNGAGALTLASLNACSGGTTLNSGTLISGTTAGLGSGPVTLNAGILRVLPSNVGSAITNFGGNGTGWMVNSSGISSTPITNDVLTLTDNAGGEARSAFFATPQPFALGSNGFTASFTYQPSGNVAADGVAFILQNDSRGAAAIGGGGGSLGFAGISPSAALEINIYNGHTIGTNFVTNGSSGTYNATGAVNVASGDPISVTLKYDPVLNTVAETLTDSVANTTFSATYSSVNLAATLGASSAYIGLSGATGGATSTQTISNFSYSVSTTTSPGVYANNIILPGGANSTIDVGATAANPTISMGTLSVGSGAGTILNVTATTAPMNQAYGLTLGITTLSGNVTLNVANNTDGGGNATGTLSLGAVSGGAGFGITVSGTGAVVLRSANSYSGGTSVNGTLKLVDGSTNNIASSPLVTIGAAGNLDVTGLASGSLLLGAGGHAQTLQGTGRVTGGLSVAGGGTLAGASGGTLTITGGVNLQNGSISSFAVGIPNGTESPATALVNVAGSLSVTGTNTVNFSGTAQLGTYELYAFTGAAPTLNQFSLGTLPAGNFHFALSVTLGNELDLNVTNPIGSAAWNFNGGGKYSDISKWDPHQIPNGAAFVATFGGGTTNTINAFAVTVTVDDVDTAGTLTFNNSNVSYTLGNDGVAGHGLTLNNNGSGANVNVTAGNQSIFSSLTLADAATFNIAAGSSLLLSIGNISESGGSRSLTKIGGGTLTIDTPSSYTGTTTVTTGTLQTTPSGTISAGALIVSAAAGVNSIASLNNDQTVSSLSGTVAGTGTARVSVAGGTTLTVAQSANTTFAGTLALSGATAALSKSGGGTLELDGAPTLAGGSALGISSGTLRFNVTSGSATIGTGVAATVSNAATLELAGSVSALGSAGGNRVHIINGGTASAGLLVSGTNQQVGNIDGLGATQVNAGSDLTANHVIQSTLIIGGTTTSHGRVTIDASDSSGNPLITASAESSGSLLAGALQPSVPVGIDGMGSFNSRTPSISFAADGSSLGTSNTLAFGSGSNATAASVTAVPEPATLLLLALGGLASLAPALRRRPTARCRGTPSVPTT